MSSEPRDEAAEGESFASMFEKQASTAPKRRGVRTLRVGDRIEATVVQIGRDAVFVELDGSRQAFLEAAELRAPDGTLAVRVGDKITAHVLEASDQQVRLGKTMARTGDVADFERAREAQVPLEGKVVAVNKGGLEIDLGGGTRAFCPMSQADARFVEDPNALVGKTLRVLVTQVKTGKGGVVVSRRALLEREGREAAHKVVASLVPGAVARGTVTAVRDFGAFVDLGGVEGLIPRSEIAHDRGISAADAVKPGDVVDVQVRDVKQVTPERPGGSTVKITLSLKALAADPWEALDLPEGRVVRGTVTRVVEFGAFVRLPAGVEGLLHASEMGKKPPAAGESLAVVVKKVDRDAKKIGLVLAPEGASEGAVVRDAPLGIGAIVHGSVVRIETYGVFVQIDGTSGRAGRGLVPAAELGVPRGTDLRKSFPEGTKLTVKVLETGEGKLRLSVRGAKDDEERAQFDEVRAKAAVPANLGTLGDLIKKKNR